MRGLSIAIVVLWAGGVVWAGAAEPTPAPVKPLPEGVVLEGVDGRVVNMHTHEGWFFETVADVNVGDTTLPGGTRFRLLPSAPLAGLIADVNDRHMPRYRLSASVTRYRGRNFLFPSYYLPLSKIKEAESGAEPNEIKPAPEPIRPPVAPANPDLAIPQVILDKLNETRFVPKPFGQTEPTGQTPSTRIPSRMLVDVVGFIKNHEGRPVFVPDAFGRSVSPMHYEVLAGQVLEQVERRQAASPEPFRVKVAGLVSEFQGAKYLLLQRAVRVYNYGNFGG